MRRLAARMLAASVGLCALGASAALAEQPRPVRQALSAHEAFEKGLEATKVRMNDDRTGIILYDRVLIEDDGPGISSDARWMITDKAPTTKVGGDVRIRKVLHVERPQALAARLYVERGLQVKINGSPVGTPSGTHYPPIPTELLRAGDNEIVLSCPSDEPRTVKMARPEDILRNAPERRGTPKRSFVSTDGGKTWKPADGEHMVRLHLVQYAREGRVVSPTVDLGRGKGDASVLLCPVTIESVSLKADTATPDGTAVRMAARTGPCPVHDDALWSAWQPADAIRVPKGHRYLQWQAILTSNDPTDTPVLKEVTVEATVSAGPKPAWAGNVKVLGHHNEEIRYTSIPFVYEDPRHPKMAALRKKYKLDEVVAGAGSELEQMVKLRDWVAQQWRFTAPKENYPAWDADEILSRKYGFCVQYAIVFMQCATALGHQARFVFGNHSGAIDGGGHEVCEWWSNEYGKWIFFDVNQNWHHINPKTGVPYNLLDIHDAIIKHYYGGGFADWRKRPRQAAYSPEFACCYGPTVVPNEPRSERKKKWHIKDGLYRVPSRWLNIRYMPRNNFLSRPRPVPMCQGTHWDWPDFIIYEDVHTPKQWLYRNVTARRSDIAWTINQVRFDAAWGSKPGTIGVQMGTFTPHFDTFLVKVGDADWRESGRAFAWTLKPGRNRLEMRARNNVGVRGPASYIEVHYEQ